MSSSVIADIINGELRSFAQEIITRKELKAAFNIYIDNNNEDYDGSITYEEYKLKRFELLLLSVVQKKKKLCGFIEAIKKEQRFKEIERNNSEMIKNITISINSIFSASFFTEIKLHDSIAVALGDKASSNDVIEMSIGRIFTRINVPDTNASEYKKIIDYSMEILSWLLVKEKQMEKAD